jgi:cell division protein FtsA
LQNQAELLKIKFGSALAEENKENEVVTIPGFAGRPPKEVSVKNLAHIIQARVEEIFESVLYEIKSSGLEKKLAAGIVITGGGSQLKHLDKLAEFVTGIDARIGYANVHIAKTNFEEITSPMYATGVGLIIKGFKDLREQALNNTKAHSAKKATVNENAEDTESGFLRRLVRQGKRWLMEDDNSLKDF